MLLHRPVLSKPFSVGFTILILTVTFLFGCATSEPRVVEKEIIKEVEVVRHIEVPVEVVKEVEVTRTVEVPVEKEVTKYVQVPVEVEIEKEVVKHIEVPVEVIVEKEIVKRVEVPVEVEVEKEVIKEIEVIKYVEIPVEVEKEVIRTTESKGRFFVRAKETENPEEWQLAVGKSRWKTGYSAKSLAFSWEEAEGFPPSVQQALDQSGIQALSNLRFVRGHVEHKVSLPGGSAASQNDIFVLAESDGQLVVIMVEGKVRESFGQYVSDWLENISPRSGKPARLQFLKEKLGIKHHNVSQIRYQLLHRTASALIEAERFGASTAVMLVHSFSQDDKHIDDYNDFVALFGGTGGVNTVSYAGNKNGIDLYLAWVRGNPIYLEK